MNAIYLSLSFPLFISPGRERERESSSDRDLEAELPCNLSELTVLSLVNKYSH